MSADWIVVSVMQIIINKIEGCRSCKYNTVCMDCRAIEYSVTHDLYAECFCDEVSKISSIKKNNEGK